MNARLPQPLRRGACPGLSAPMPTGDGLLVRLVPADAFPLDAFVALCMAARAHGNGLMEVTARGSLQVRGLTPASAPLFTTEVARLDIAAAEGVPVIAGPLPDDPEAIIDAGRLAAELRGAIAQARLALAPKVSVVIDGGGPLHLDALAADIRLLAIGPAMAPRLLVALGALLPPPLAGKGWGGGRLRQKVECHGGWNLEEPPPQPSPSSGGGERLDLPAAHMRFPSPETRGGGAPNAWLGVIAPERAVDVVLGLLREIAAHGPTARGADVVRTRGIDALRSQFDIEPVPLPAARPPAEMVGLHRLGDRSLALGVALAFGHAQADALVELARCAAAQGAQSIRPAPDRALMLIGVAPERASALAVAAERLGFVARADDPRRRVAACPGAPACASGFIEARRLAAAIAPQLAGVRARIAVHVSGCAKGCAHPGPAALTVVGDAQGCGIIRDGTTRETPRYHVAPDDLAAEIACAFAEGEAGHG
jgi:precorrin-3B synthase